MAMNRLVPGRLAGLLSHCVRLFPEVLSERVEQSNLCLNVR